MKKFLIVMTVLMLALCIAGCGIGEKAGEALAEKILGDAGMVTDIDGDKVVIEGEGGEELTIGAGEWPLSVLAKSIPEFKGGNIVSVMETDDSLFIAIEEISEEDFASYLDDVKQTFTENSYEMSTETGMMYSAGNGKDLSVMLSFEKDSGLSITVSQTEPLDE